MEKRKSERTRCQFGCKVTLRSESAAGTVVDISEGGLSVQTQLEGEQGDALTVRIQHPREGVVELETIVWHVRKVRQRQTGEIGFVLGLVLSKAPEAYLGLLPGTKDTAPAKPAPQVETSEFPPGEEASDLDEFHVRLKSRSGPRTRLLNLDAPSSDEARSLALEGLGDDWEVLEIRKL